ncbi:MAG: tellurite resistance TerB family protein [Burkholderiaceae bacterium]|nr:tellurite resistance TerB family protein [Burkholderiaceae bacterium]
MSAQAMLERLLKSGLGGFGGGAAAGGVLGLLLGSKQGRRYGGKALKYGGIAAIGLMAWKAYEQYQQQQQQTRAGMAPPAAAAQPPATVDRLPAPEAEQHSRAMLLAMMAAAKADGHLDERERGLLGGELDRLAAASAPGDNALRDWVAAQLERPLDPAEVARAAATPALAAEVYLASLLVADEQSFMERAYLDELARQLGLAPQLKAQLEAQAAA